MLFLCCSCAYLVAHMHVATLSDFYVGCRLALSLFMLHVSRRTRFVEYLTNFQGVLNLHCEGRCETHVAHCDHDGRVIRIWRRCWGCCGGHGDWAGQIRGGTCGIPPTPTVQSRRHLVLCMMQVSHVQPFHTLESWPLHTLPSTVHDHSLTHTHTHPLTRSGDGR